MKRLIGQILLTLCILIICPKIDIYAAEKKQVGTIESITNEIGSLLTHVKYEDLKKLLDFAAKQIEEGNWETKEGIDRAIKAGEEEFQVTLTAKEKEKIHSLVERVKELKISPQFLLDQAEKIFEKYGKELSEQVEENKNKIVQETKEKITEEVKSSVKDYFSEMVGRVKQFFLSFTNKQT